MDNLTRIIGGAFLILIGLAALVFAVGSALRQNAPVYLPAPSPYQVPYQVMPYGPNYQPTPNCPYPNCPNPDHNRRPGDLDSGSGNGKLGSKGAKE